MVSFGVKDIGDLLGGRVKAELEALDCRDLTEIRIRVNKPLAFMFKKGFRISSYVISKEETEILFKRICGYSIHSFTENIARGFITIRGGHRVGICGTAVMEKEKIVGVRDISSLNIRIARQINFSDGRLKSFCAVPQNLLIAGEPSSGKTTFLKALIKELAEKYKVSVIDERGELGAVYMGQPQIELGTMSDIFDGYTKETAVEIAIRTMSPHIIVCDEIGNEKDAESILQAQNSGVKIIATAHLGSKEELFKKMIIKKLLNAGAFEKIIILKGSESPSEIAEVVECD